MNTLGNGTTSGDVYQSALANIRANNYSTRDIINAVTNFKRGSLSNSNGMYNSFDLIYNNQLNNEALYKSYYPTLQQPLQR